MAKACKAIANKLCGKTGRMRTQQLTPGALKHAWASGTLADEPTVPFPDSPPPWYDASPTYHDKLTAAKAQQQKPLQQIKAEHLRIWTDSWKAYQSRTIDEPSISQAAPPLDKRRLKIHAPAERRQKVLLRPKYDQEKLGLLLIFLHKRRVPGFNLPPPLAPLRAGYRQTPKHVIHALPTYERQKGFMFSRLPGTRDLSKSFTESLKPPLKMLTAWAHEVSGHTEPNISPLCDSKLLLSAVVQFTHRFPLFFMEV